MLRVFRVILIVSCLPGCALHQPSGRPGSQSLKPATAAAARQQSEVRRRPAEAEEYRRDNIPANAVPAIAGTAVNTWSDQMICAARCQQLAIARHCWYAGGSVPGPDGRRQIEAAAGYLRENAGLLLVEAEPVQPGYDESLEEAIARTEVLNHQRRECVVATLTAAGVPSADQRTELGVPRPVGIRGIESPRIYNQLSGGGMGQGQRGGQGGMGGMGGGVGGGMGGGFGGGGGLF
jgi:uncharacterized membrane protein YgcG